MIRINKNLLKFVILALFLGLGLFIFLSKFLPLFLQHSVYFCQQFIHSFSIKIPNQFGYVIPIVLAIMAATLLYKLVSIYREVQSLRKHLTSYEKTRHGLHKLLKKLNLQDKVYVIQSEKPFAFCVGVRHQKIYLSTMLLSLMSEKELEAILLHEKYHLKNLDSIIMLRESLLQLVFPFFPIVQDLIMQYKINREIDADWEAVQKLGDSKPVISVLKKFLSFPSVSFASVSAIADYETLEPRINALIKKEKKFRQFKVKNALISFLTVLIFSAIVISPVNAIEMHMPKQDATMLCLQGDACAGWCKEHNTVIPYSVSPTHTVNASYMDTPVSK